MPSVGAGATAPGPALRSVGLLFNFDPDVPAAPSRPLPQPSPCLRIISPAEREVIYTHVNSQTWTWLGKEHYCTETTLRRGPRRSEPTLGASAPALRADAPSVGLPALQRRRRCSAFGTQRAPLRPSSARADRRVRSSWPAAGGGSRRIPPGGRPDVSFRAEKHKSAGTAFPA